MKELDSCGYTDCDYCCLYNGEKFECVAKEECIGWLTIFLLVWLTITIIILFAAIARKRNIS